MSTGIIDVIKESSLNAFDATNPVAIYFGKVSSADPVKVDIDADGKKFTLGKEQLVVNGSVSSGDDVVLIRCQGGQKYVVLGTRVITEETTVYVGGGTDADISNADISNTSFCWPAPKYTRISSKYGYRIHPIYKTKKFHSGVDLAAPGDSPILAILDGVVTAATQDSKNGKYVVIKHTGGFQASYCHASKLLVKKGDNVKKGQEIAKVGSTGASTGNHLHLTLRLNGNLVDPLKYLRKP
jgi:murein DD-endopeptidase MepM/ murein hydrolase activator NlpD